jgi:hypothetical protein
MTFVVVVFFRKKILLGCMCACVPVIRAYVEALFIHVFQKGNMHCNIEMARALIKLNYINNLIPNRLSTLLTTNYRINKPKLFPKQGNLQPPPYT